MRSQQGLGRQRAKTVCRAHRIHRKKAMHFPAEQTTHFPAKEISHAAGAVGKLPIAATSTDAEPPKGGIAGPPR